MEHPGFAYLWQQQELSDVLISLYANSAVHSVEDGPPDAHNSTHTLLQQFPGHSAILGLSEYFKAQVLRWPPLPQSEGNTQSGIATYTPSSTQQGRGVVITLPDASYEPAAVAVLAGLYQIKLWSMLLADLTPQQQVHAAVLADMWQLTSARDAALGALLEPTKITDRASAGSPGVSPEQLDSFLSNFRAVRRSREQVSAALDQLLRLECMPDCLLPVFEQMLLSKYGHLEDAWADTALQQSLLALPLSAVELLLASDKLKVASEDTVLHTAQAYVDNLAAAGHDILHAVDRLAPLVRCPHLSQFWLSASVLSDDADRLLLRGLQHRLKRLLLLKQGVPAGSIVTAADISANQDVPLDMPISWGLSVRDIQPPVNSVLLEWGIDVLDEIIPAAQASASQQQTTILRSHPSKLLGGIRWCLELKCNWDASRQGSTIDAYVCALPPGLPVGVVRHCTYSLQGEWAGDPGTGLFEATHQLQGTSGLCSPDYFKIGAVAGGFDQAAWVARGLPTDDFLYLKLRVTVEDVCK